MRKFFFVTPFTDLNIFVAECSNCCLTQWFKGKNETNGETKTAEETSASPVKNAEEFFGQLLNETKSVLHATRPLIISKGTFAQLEDLLVKYVRCTPITRIGVTYFVFHPNSQLSILVNL